MAEQCHWWEHGNLKKKRKLVGLVSVNIRPDLGGKERLTPLSSNALSDQQNICVIDQLVRSRWLDIDPKFFYAFFYGPRTFSFGTNAGNTEQEGWVASQDTIFASTRLLADSRIYEKQITAKY